MNQSKNSLEFNEFLDNSVWEKNKDIECNECGSIDIEKDVESKDEIYMFWCNNCNYHVFGCDITVKL